MNARDSEGGARDPEGGARDPEGGARDSEGGARDPQAEAAVARLLAEVGGSVPMPAHVAARLDDVLAGLERERAGGSTAAVSDDVVELRTRRRWPRLVLAAAAVVVGGYSVGTVLTEGTLSGSSDTSSAESAGSVEDSGGGRDLRDNDRAGKVDQGDQGAGGVEAEESAPLSGDFMRLGSPVVLRSDELETGVRRALRVLDRELPETSDMRSGATQLRSHSGCPAPDLSERQRSLSVRYDGVRGVLVAGPPREGVVRVVVYDCSGTQLDSTRVPR